MKKIILFASLLTGTFINAQNFSLGAKSGDSELDMSLSEINVKAKTDIKLFKKDLSIEFNIGEKKIDNMLEIQMSPADVFMTLQVADLVKKDPEIIVDSFKKNKDKGWGVIAKENGIKPGSPEFHQLKGKAKNKKNKDKKDKGEKGNGKGKGKNK
ncbi:MAG: hypothetical protein Q7W45_15985 [Bacteroidota bacterium]|nr:hypothetical protein [Bacteroidota bacterium]MDP3145484.1 hypothetical protein [Bacteroidota bacterium]